MSPEAGLGLPPLIDHHDYATLGEWLEVVHGQYRAITGEAGLTILGMRLESLGRRGPDGRSDRFWHLVSEACGGGQRRLSLRRAAVLGRVWHVLELFAAGDPRACAWWGPNRNGRRHLVVMPVDFSLKIVLEERGGVLFLLTAFPLKRNRRRRVLTSADARPAESRRRVRRSPRHWRRLSARHLLVAGERV